MCSPVTWHFVRNPMYFEQQGRLTGEGSSVGCDEPEKMLIFEGAPYREFPEEDWVSAPVKKGKSTKISFLLLT